MASKLNQATEINDCHKLGDDFSRIANGYPNEWLPAYYAAYCYARIGWLNQYAREKIEPFTDQADKQIGKTLALVDTLNQKKAVSEIYSVLSMINRARVVVNPVTQGSKYGPLAYTYAQKLLALNKDNPRAMYLDAWNKYYRPVAFGGDKEKARELPKKARGFFEKESTTSPWPYWGKTECEILLKKYKYYFNPDRDRILFGFRPGL